MQKGMQPWSPNMSNSENPIQGILGWTSVDWLCSLCKRYLSNGPSLELLSLSNSTNPGMTFHLTLTLSAFELKPSHAWML